MAARCSSTKSAIFLWHCSRNSCDSCRRSATNAWAIPGRANLSLPGCFSAGSTLDEAIALGKAWLDAGAEQLVVEARESALGVGAFGNDGSFNAAFADRFAEEFGLDIAIFEAPNKVSQFALLEHFGQRVHLCNVRLEEVLRVEIFRRGLHSDAFAMPNLRPTRPISQTSS